jgi:glycosyltransferase involved in cell wall biosynthesis
MVPGGQGVEMKCARKYRIVLLTGNSLCHNPRALKEASALARAGHEVSVFGAWLDPKFKMRDLRLMEKLPFAFVPVFDMTSSGFRHDAARSAQRACKKTADLAFRLTGWQSPFQLGFGIGRFVKRALQADADLYIAHSEPCLYVGHKLLRCGRRIGVDMEDWFSEDLLPEARRHRPLHLLRFLEGELLRNGAYASCPSHVMSKALADAYRCTPPSVIYNTFAWSEREMLGGATSDRRDPNTPSIHWFSTTIGPGRGLEELLAALPHVKYDLEIHLRGSPAIGFEEWADAQTPPRWRNRIFFHPPVDNDELLPRIAEHDIGFAGEMKYCRSRDLTVSNKIMHYMVGGLAVVASDTAGQSEVAQQAPDAVLLYTSGDAQALAQLLNGLLGSPERLSRVKTASLEAAKRMFCWERQEGALVESVARAFGHMPAGGEMMARVE